MKYYLSFISWTIFVVYLNLVAPVTFLNSLTFFVILFLAIYTTTLIFFRKLKLNLLLSFYLLSLPVLVFFKQFNILNPVLISLFFGAIYLFLK